MSHNPLTQLEFIVQDAEVDRHTRNTAEVQRYLDSHPALSQYTRNLTQEIQDKILFHLADGDKAEEAQIREEVKVIRSQIDALQQPGNMLFSLLSEEIVLSYLMLRQCDVSSSRSYGQTSAPHVRRSDAAHVRFMRSLRTLASMQKLTPFINLNLGMQQIVNN